MPGMALPSPSPSRRSFARWLIRSEPVALVLLLLLAVLLFALIMIGYGRPARPLADPATTVAADSHSS